MFDLCTSVERSDNSRKISKDLNLLPVLGGFFCDLSSLFVLSLFSVLSSLVGVLLFWFRRMISAQVL